MLPLKRHAFKRAITNLVSNAVRYGDHIVIRAATEGTWLRVEVDDNGPGIPASERANVFKPFYRIDSARNQNEGNSGLGPRHRARHRQEPRRGHHPRRKLHGRAQSDHLAAALKRAQFSLEKTASNFPFKSLTRSRDWEKCRVVGVVTV